MYNHKEVIYTMLKKLSCVFKAEIGRYKRYKQTAYRVLEIDSESQEAVLQCLGKRIVFRKNLVDIMDKGEMVSGLFPVDACWIGFYCGRASRSSSKKAKSASNFSFPVSHALGQYRLVSENGITGELRYFDKIYQKEFLELPTAIVQSSYIVNKFDPSQACYIGFLAGIMIEKKLSKDMTSDKQKFQALLQNKPTLRIIK